MTSRPFRIDVPQAVLDDLSQRLALTRFPDAIVGAGWAYGTDPDYLRTLVEYWHLSYDWRAAEASLNALAQLRHHVDGLGLHVVHERSASPDATPLLLLHGWPSTFVQMERIIPLLTDPETPGAPLHVVVPSLPGYGFSDRPTRPGMSVGRIGELLHRLMADLGYERYVIRATDLGAGVATQMAIGHPVAVAGLHTSGTNPFLMNVPDDLTPAEQEFVANAQQWMQTEMAYAQVHSSKPQTIAAALNDSPAGLAAWIIEKFWRWTDHDGDLETAISRDDLLTNLTIYWVTGTINSSMRLYYETARDPGTWGAVAAPSAHLQFSGDMFATPREWVERSGPVARWIDGGRGGHFPEWERPETVAADLRQFVSSLA